LLRVDANVVLLGNPSSILEILFFHAEWELCFGLIIKRISVHVKILGLSVAMVGVQRINGFLTWSLLDCFWLNKLTTSIIRFFPHFVVFLLLTLLLLVVKHRLNNVSFQFILFANAIWISIFVRSLLRGLTNIKFWTNLRLHLGYSFSLLVALGSWLCLSTLILHI
jgi:hypothetical protein